MNPFIRAALTRAVRTVAQTALGTIGAAVAFEQVDWRFVASAAGLAGVMSMLTSLAGLPEAAQTGVVGVPEALPEPDPIPTTGALGRFTDSGVTVIEAVAISFLVVLLVLILL